MTNALLEQVKQANSGGKLADQSADTGSYEYTPPAEGPTAARLVGYIEIGKRKQPDYQGKPKPDANEAILYFELLSKKHAKEVGEGEDKKIVYPIIREKVQIKSGERANFVKLLKKMSYGRDIPHMAMMLGEAFLLRIVHNKSKDGSKTYANIRTKEDGYLVGAPMYNANKDPLGDEDMKPLPVPEPTVPLKLLLWNDPTKEQWDSIFIDGTRTVKAEDGTESEVSRNWMQEDIIENATDFEGSALHALLLEQGGMVLDGGENAAQDAADEPEKGVSSSEAPEAQKEDKAAPAAAQGGDDPLADLGIDL